MSSDSGRLAGKVAVITGTAGGQGRAAALLFASEGAIVYGCDIKVDEARETADLVESSGGLMIDSSPLDLTDPAAVSVWLDSVSAEHGRIDILYANAGATRFSPVADTSLEDWKFVLTYELDVVFLPVKHAWRHLQRSQAGAVILVGSTAGVSGSVTNPRIAHTATKGAVVAMTKQLAAEGASCGIRVNCVSPGMIRTPATEADLLSDDHPMSRIALKIPMGRVGLPGEVASCALFLASEEASYVTGANLMIDGGWSAVLPGA
ncbi:MULTISPECIES: SDR family NAD(P)-dependent oxidoreductase [Rhodococcus]|uniref:SDR family NAD(P)-dependent oxidoreductase n=1 Tax=Rhodococcus globerulus TaxID=33008 RepID=A0ABU4BNJ0_RHOGO|nr:MULTISPECIES: SDR family NAD(P)-dependent oxidoreductase [Rhodococcus]MDV6265770.1 SDR family NAD(P)-dependent oxidoreductase [Rhodococcus globerulus]MDV8066913.1 SDR family NAD(P)-dependent oxidoreductase [Rhodococcus sp. IEGM 1366]